MTDAADRLPPQDLEAEQATLGAMLIDPEAVVRARALVRAEDFYREAHREIFSAIEHVADSGGAVDPVTVAAELRRREALERCGGGEYLTALIAQVPTSAHTIRYGSIVADCAVLRALVRLGAELQSAAYDKPDDPAEVLAEAARAIADLCSTRTAGRGAVRAAEYAEAMMMRLETAMEAPPHVSAARLGIADLDRQMGGLAGHGLVVVRGVEKAGKSMVGLNAILSSALEFAEEGENGRCAVAYVLEGQDVWEERAMAWLGEFSASVFSPASPVTAKERERFRQAAQKWRGLPLYVSGSIFDLDRLLTDLRRISISEQIGLVLIDYAQLIQGGQGDTLVQAAEDKANRIAALAAELRCPIIVPSQLTDGQAGRHAKWARAWDEAATLVFDVERGPEGRRAQRRREDWQAEESGRLRLHACRRRPPFGVHAVRFDLATGHITDAPEGGAGASGEMDQRW